MGERSVDGRRVDAGNRVRRHPDATAFRPRQRMRPCARQVYDQKYDAADRGGEKKLAEPEGPAKFEQGGFTSRRRKGPKTLFPGASPGNSLGRSQPE